MRKLLRIGLGVGLILVGLVGILLPIMPGWVFIIPGLVILAEYSPRIRRLLEWVKAKFEEARKAAQRNSAAKASATMEDRSGPGQ